MGRQGTKKMNVTKDKGKQVEELHDNNPVKPVRPPSDFIAYRIDFARKQKTKGNALTMKELNIASRNAWNKLSDEEKLVWKNEADMKKYKELMKIYKESIADTGKSIKSDETKQAYRFRCTPAKFLKLVGRIDGAKIAAIKEIGFGGLLEIQCHILPSIICMWLVNNFNPTHSYIQLEGGRVLPVTSEDIAKPLGIPGEGPVPVKDTRDDGIDSEPHYPRKKKYNWHDIEDELISMEVGDEFKRLFVIFACKCLLAPTTRVEIKANLWESLQSTSEIAKFNWAEFVRVDLCKKLLNMQSNAHKNVGGCILFLLDLPCSKSMD
ncbi:uncharacterized protein [Coffea arabica]|uniref:HMG box domain-containing protein n=1 Tax=Coffea arabica TaxID=13443 RepID=A0A6P6TFE8_COFAR|nr:uncharacterized protein LOC113700067 isoform X2 [Coffea arabica]XP_027076334.1 uncharacterized protein LOC113700067 isoform X2 [Coffea arabica]